MIIQEAGEMYLETILRLKQKTGAVRSVDIAREMGYSKPTVSEQMKKFRENGYIEVDEEGHILLTPKGEEIANATWERHNVLGRILQKIGVSKKAAIEDACRIEHYISEETFLCLKKYFQEEE
mgnify:CR=1 FL=1